jgi:hypothetical protein
MQAMGVRVVRYDIEADVAIASLARNLPGAYVLGNDSDFFIFENVLRPLKRGHFGGHGLCQNQSFLLRSRSKDVDMLDHPPKSRNRV